MTFNDISWGYVDEKQALPHAYTAQRILKMINKCAFGAGNLLLNIGPKPDGSVPADAVEPLTRSAGGSSAMAHAPMAASSDNRTQYGQWR